MSDDEKIKQLTSKNKQQAELIKIMYSWQKTIAYELKEIKEEMQELIKMVRKK